MLKFKKVIAILIAIGLMITANAALIGCDGGGDSYDNESTRLVFASGEFDGMFNPFFATSANDMAVNEMTQMGLISSNSEGKVSYGANEACIALDYTNVVTDNNKIDDEDYDNYFTTYEFLIKNNVKFSDGSKLTVDDILFNFYVYLDPAYSGASTLYSTDIKGLDAYRYQTYDQSQQEHAEEYFERLAVERIDDIKNWTAGSTPDSETMARIEADLEIIEDLFREELNADWNTAVESLDSYMEDYSVAPNKITDVWQVYLIFMGEISEKTRKVGDETVKYLEWNGLNTDPPTDTSKEAMINRAFNSKFSTTIKNMPDQVAYKNNVFEVISYWNTSVTAKAYFVTAEKEAYFEEIIRENDGLLVSKVSGISKREVAAGEKFNNKTLSEKHDVLTIVVNGVDPKAVWNFGFSVAPKKFYTNQPFNYAEDQFGVQFSSTTFMNYVKQRQVPIGAGPYKAINNTTNKSDFFKNNLVHFERNEHFLMGPAKIKYIDYKVINANQMYDAVAVGDVHYATVNAKPIFKQNAINDKNLDYAETDQLGYGYIGINARFVNDYRVRQAFMHAMNTALCLNYYTNGMATLVHRSMTSNSWAYPVGATSRYTYDPTGETSKELIEDAGYSLVNGVYQRPNSKGVMEKLKFTFTVAGDSTDHPAYNLLSNAAAILNGIGCDISVQTDTLALVKLASGQLAIWAAAWTSTIDPDMYQVYHKDSQASSVLNWGYDWMKENGSEYELGKLDLLAQEIEAGRRVLEETERKIIYARALDLVSDLAIELPTYQRKNLVVYRKDAIDKNTLNSNPSAYEGLISKIWEVSFVNG